MSMSRPWEGTTGNGGQRQISGAVYSRRTTPELAYIDLISKWETAPGLKDKDMGDVYIYQTIKDEFGVDVMLTQLEVPPEAMLTYQTFTDWLNEIGISKDEPGFAMFTKSFATDFIT